MLSQKKNAAFVKASIEEISAAKEYHDNIVGEEADAIGEEGQRG